MKKKTVEICDDCSVNEAELICDCRKVYCRKCANYNENLDIYYCPECHDELGDLKIE